MLVLLAIIIMMTLSACVVFPADVPGKAEQPQNRPPRIIEDLTYPSPEETVIILNSNCPVHFFRTYVNDPDRDTIYYRIFINYHLVPTIYSEGLLDPNSFDNNGREQISIYLSEDNNGHFIAAQNQGYNFDVVELIVSDRPFSDDDIRVPGPDGIIDRFTWTISRRDLGLCID